MIFNNFKISQINKMILLNINVKIMGKRINQIFRIHIHKNSINLVKNQYKNYFSSLIQLKFNKNSRIITNQLI